MNQQKSPPILSFTGSEFIRKLRTQRTHASATLIGVVRAGSDSNSLMFSLLGRDSWVAIPQEMVERVDSLGQIRQREEMLEHVRLYLHAPADGPEVLSELLKRVHTIPDEFPVPRRRQDDDERDDFPRIHPMGVFGWNELQDNVTLVGRVTGHNYSGDHPFGDGDWNLEVRPDPGYTHLLVNSHGRGNDDGIVECEICPIDADGGGDREARFFSRLQNQQVVVTGTWVEDKSHDDKTEIHPITSIRCYDGQYLHLFVFSDDSDNFPAHVPHSKENRVARIRYDLPRGARFYIAGERNHCRSRNIRIVDDRSGYYLLADIESGTPDEGNGFYYAALAIAMGLPPNPQLPNPPHGHYFEVTFTDDNDERNGLIELMSDTNAYGKKSIPPNATAEHIAVLCSALASELNITNWRHPTVPKVLLYGQSIWIRCDPGVFELSEGDL